MTTKVRASAAREADRTHVDRQGEMGDNVPTANLGRRHDAAACFEKHGMSNAWETGVNDGQPRLAEIGALREYVSEVAQPEECELGSLEDGACINL